MIHRFDIYIDITKQNRLCAMHIHCSYYMFLLVSEIEHDVMQLVSMTSYQCPVPIATTSGELILYRNLDRDLAEEPREQSE